MELPLHGEVVYQELQTDLEKAIQDHSSAVFQKIKQDAQAYNFLDAIPTACNTGQSAASSATEVLKEKHPSGISFGITDGTLEGDSGIVSGIPVPIRTSANDETEDSDVVFVATAPALSPRSLWRFSYHNGPEMPSRQRLPLGMSLKLLPLNKMRLSAPSSHDES